MRALEVTREHSAQLAGCVPLRGDASSQPGCCSLCFSAVLPPERGLGPSGGLAAPGARSHHALGCGGLGVLVPRHVLHTRAFLSSSMYSAAEQGSAGD